MSRPSSGTEGDNAKPESILGRPFVEGILELAKGNLRKDGSLMPVLFLQPHDDKLRILPLDLPPTTEEKYAYFEIIGLAVLSTGKRLDEALFLSETWYVSQDEDPNLTSDIRPSQHPSRREAISIVGRNAERTRFTFVIEPFRHAGKQRFVFEPRTVEEYNSKIKEGIEPEGLLDALFTS